MRHGLRFKITIKIRVYSTSLLFNGNWNQPRVILRLTELSILARRKQTEIPSGYINANTKRKAFYLNTFKLLYQLKFNSFQR